MYNESKLAIYRLYFDDEIVYIGQTVNLVNRLLCHVKDKRFNSVDLIEVDTEDADCVEAYLILEHSPTLNKSVRGKLFAEGRRVFVSKYGNHKFTTYEGGIPPPPRPKTITTRAIASYDVTTKQANYYQAITPITCAASITNTATGEVLRLSLFDKHVLCYIKHFCAVYEQTGGAMFEAQESIAESTGMDRKTAHRSIKRLCDLGVLVKTVFFDAKGVSKKKHVSYVCANLSEGMFIFTREWRSVDTSGKETSCAEQYVVVDIVKKIVVEKAPEKPAMIVVPEKEPEPVPPKKVVMPPVGVDNDEGCPF